MKKSVVTEVIALLYVCLLLYTGVSKLMNYELSREQMAVMPLAGQFAGFVTWALPAGEILLSIIIFIPATRIRGLYAGTALMFAFTLYVAYLMAYHSSLPCTCGGFLQELTWTQHLFFNLGFVVIGVLAIILSRTPNKPSAKPGLSF